MPKLSTERQIYEINTVQVLQTTSVVDLVATMTHTLSLVGCFCSLALIGPSSRNGDELPPVWSFSMNESKKLTNISFGKSELHLCLWFRHFLYLWHVLIAVWRHVVHRSLIWNRWGENVLSAALLLQETNQEHVEHYLQSHYIYSGGSLLPVVGVWPPLSLCSPWPASWLGLLLLSSCSLHLKLWPCSQNGPLVSQRLQLLHNTH